MRKVALSLILVSSLLIPAGASAATAKAGAKCTKLKSTQIVGAKKFTCVKSGKKLVWDKGVAIPKVVVKKAQEIDFPAIEARYLLEKRIALTPGTTTGGLPVAVSGSGACSYDAATSEIVLNSLGTCSLTASQAGDANFLPATSITRSFEIKKIAQIIKAPEVTDQDLLKANSYQFEFPQVGSSTPFVISTKTSDICTVDGTKVAFNKIGSCVLAFNKAGDEFYEAANEATATFKLFLSAQPGEKANPAALAAEATRGGITVSLDGINEGVSGDVCAADSANKGCVEKNGVGVFQSSPEYDRYVEVLLSIVNNSTKVWIADNLTLQLTESRKFAKNTVYTIDSLDGLELEPGDGISGSYFVLVQSDVDIRNLIVIYGDATEAGTFYFKVK
jgi:hypothetical protein